ncbi:MAG: ATP-binding protein [Candidatus Magasanikbacteria bacterium]|nr:ATP-binding protein [Candidatus Magasanikbacteria bacterium]
MLHRHIEEEIQKYLSEDSNKIFFIWGPRRSGKTTILKKIKADFGYPRFNFDLISDRDKFQPVKHILARIAEEHDVILIDEVQNYPEATVSLKILHDEFNIKIIATGSSELRQKSNQFDSLAGRFIERYCLSFSVEEVYVNSDIKKYDVPEWWKHTSEYAQIYGMYPELSSFEDGAMVEEKRIDALQNILDTYILKDIIQIYNLKDTKLAQQILISIALQLGSEVSIRELANNLKSTAVTVSNYIEIFIKNYVLIEVSPFKTNIRRAISQHKKLYFTDLGVRNILIRDFRPLALRQDKGGVFENFVISEIYKKIKNHHKKLSMYFYRQYDGREVDLVLEDYYKNYTCLEIKYMNGVLKDVFPLPYTGLVLNSENFFEYIQNL